MAEAWRATGVEELEARAREVLPPAGFETHFGSRGALSWETNTNNLVAFSQWVIRPRILSGVHRPSLRTTVLGKPSDAFLFAPVGGQQRFHPRGELATFSAAAEADVTAVLSTMSTFSIEEVADVSGTGRRWFQAYVMRDRELTRDLVVRAKAAGYDAIVLTVDNISGHLARPRRYRLNGISDPSELVWPSQEAERMLANFRHLRGAPDMPSPTFSECFDAAFAWKDIAWLRSITDLPIVLKGVQTHEDALLAVEHGLAGIVVSNHGGVPAAMESLGSTLDRLPSIANAVQDRLEIYLDGGVRGGGDIFKALSLGARAVMLGRAVQWALASGGKSGVLDLADLLRDELSSAMCLAGVQDLGQVGRHCIERACPQS